MSMGEISFAQLVAANIWLILIVLGAGIATGLLVWRARRRRHRRLPTTIDGVRVEFEDARVDEDLIVEQNWRTTFLLTNTTRKPVDLPALSPRATVRAAGREYAASVYLEREAVELNPDDQIVVWLLARLPAGVTPETVRLVRHGQPTMALTARLP